MKRRIGLWIDHRQTVMVRVFDEGEITSYILSNVPKRVRFSGASHDQSELNPHDSFTEDKRDRHYEALLQQYYDDVMQQLTLVDELFIMGPGEAKYELQKHIEKNGLNPSLLAVEPADKMTDKQIVARVRQHFADLAHPHRK